MLPHPSLLKASLLHLFARATFQLTFPLVSSAPIFHCWYILSYCYDVCWCCAQAEMDANKRVYHDSFQTLRDTKSEIERIQRVFEAGKLRMHADFESWYVNMPHVTVSLDTCYFARAGSPTRYCARKRYPLLEALYLGGMCRCPNRFAQAWRHCPQSRLRQ